MESSVKTKVAMVDQLVSAGGGERFLHGLVGGLLKLPDMDEWELTLILARRNSAWQKVVWPDSLKGRSLRVRHIFDDQFSGRLSEAIARPGRIHGIPGTSKGKRLLQQAIIRLVSSEPDYPGQTRAWVESTCEREGIDLLYNGYPFGMDCPRVAAPIVCTIFDLTYQHLEEVEDKIRTFFDQRLEGWMRESRLVITSCDYVAEETERYFPSSRGKIRVVRLGTPEAVTGSTEELRAHLREKLLLPDSFLLNVGWVTPHKNQKVILEALGRLRDHGTHLPVVFAGPNSSMLKPGCREKGASAEYIGLMTEEARRLGLSYGSDFIALGYVDDLTLDYLYREATALVVPSLQEAGSFPGREAMRLACPVIYSRIPALIEEHELLEGVPWLFDPHDAADLARVILKMLASPEEVEARAERSAKLVNQVFSWEKTARGYIEVFQEALRTG